MGQWDKIEANGIYRLPKRQDKKPAAWKRKKKDSDKGACKRAKQSRAALMFRRVRAAQSNPTHAEIKLFRWLQKRMHGKYKLQHGVMLRGSEFFILDLYCRDLKLAIEVDGSHHKDEPQLSYDARRDTALREQKGIRVIRFSNDLVFNHPEQVMDVIRDEMSIGLGANSRANKGR